MSRQIRSSSGGCFEANIRGPLVTPVRVAEQPTSVRFWAAPMLVRMAGTGPQERSASSRGSASKRSSACGRGCVESPSRDRLSALPAAASTGRFVEGQDRRQSWLLPSPLDDDATAGNPVRVIEVFIEERDLGVPASPASSPRRRDGLPMIRPRFRSSTSTAISTECRRPREPHLVVAHEVVHEGPTGPNSSPTT